MGSRWPDLRTLGSPDREDAVRRTFEGYRQTLTAMSRDELLAELTRLSAAMEGERNRILASYLSRPPSGSSSNLDDPVLRSMTAGIPSSPRGLASESSRTSRPPNPPEAPFASRRLGQRLAASLAASSRRRSPTE